MYKYEKTGHITVSPTPANPEGANYDLGKKAFGCQCESGGSGGSNLLYIDFSNAHKAYYYLYKTTSFQNEDKITKEELEAMMYSGSIPNVAMYAAIESSGITREVIVSIRPIIWYSGVEGNTVTAYGYAGIMNFDDNGPGLLSLYTAEHTID